jgi:hypothetical protein
MPFASKSQQRAAFGGHIPGFSKEKAKEWADETDFDAIPARAKRASLGKVRYIAKVLHEQSATPGVAKNLVDAVVGEQERVKRKHAGLVELCTKIAMALPNPGQIRSSARSVGAFKGTASNHWLKPPGNSVKQQVTNPRLSLSNSMTKANRI